MAESTLQAPDRGLVLHGRITTASNATFLGSLRSASGEDVAVVYKPIRGERPLWDFPDGNLAHREVAAYLLSELTGWDVVPETWLRDGPHGTGMVQRWCEIDPTQEAVTLVPAGPGHRVPPGWRHVFDGLDARDRPVSLVHEDTPALRHMAIFDVLANNADRKGGHVLEMADGHRYGCDHGLTFHHEPKLRTVLWGWMGEPLTDEEVEVVRRVRAALDGPEGDVLGEYLAVWDLEALVERCDRLLARGVLPEADGDWHVIPWPPF
jgi:uncharacterized repeat protein (TIGR03843 family)